MSDKKEKESTPSDEEEKGLTPDDYQKAIWAQSACNLSGIVHSLSRIMPRIWEEARAAGKGTTYVNEHPIVRLFAEQITWLSRKRDYHRASDICEKGAKRGEAQQANAG